MKNKEGFISMTLVYTFLIVFLFLMASILSTYTKKSDYLEKIDSKIKEEVKLDKSPLTGEKDTSIKAVILAANTVYADNVASEYVTSATGIDFAAKSSLANGQGLYTNNKLEDGLNIYFRGGSFCAYTNFSSETTSGTYCAAAGGTWSNYTCSLNSDKPSCQSKGFIYYDLKNNVSFANHSWKIIRIDENNNIRMMLSDASAVTCSSFNSSRSDNAHVGYMFGTVPSTSYVSAHQNINSSVIKTCVESWYATNLASYASYLSDAGYCCDRTIYSTGLGYGTNDTYYSAFRRYTSSSPRLATGTSCLDTTRDLFTTSSNSIGNKSLTYPIGLITYDEGRYAGLIGGNNYENFLKFSASYWTMSPYFFISSSAYDFYINNQGVLSGTSTSITNARPIISLKPDTKVLSGTGTVTDPYVVN